MIGSKTYHGLAGLNYIQGSDLVLTDVYLVKREGLQYDKWISGSTNRTHTYVGSQGRVYFPTAFNAGGEKVFVLFKKTTTVSEPIPGVCVPAQISINGLQNGNITYPYSQSLALAGSEPFILNVNSKPSWMTIELGIGVVNLFGTPDALGTETIDFDVSNDCGTDNYNQDIFILPVLTTTYITNYTPGTLINSVSGLSIILLTGSFPLAYLANASGTHPDFTGVVSVNVSGVVFPCTLQLWINTVLIESVPVIFDDDYDFSTHAYLSTDLVQILLIP